ncbi:hypothetical protein HBO15_21330 [Pseudomonas sp. WS 5111]|jgi:hypothetical protein|uniref:hypothetical protein n=1 Tax=Pseudomonas sp. WS 5111 TaxID=2717493 RepID=UPI001473D026|nr:hypothetical protein [Pseudomonas sp. WS 5111]NMX69899.1 hypothetical protein [Pseudomonas sp. WS 5111]
MKKILSTAALVISLSASLNVQAVTAVKKYTPYEMLTKSCAVAKEVWDIKAKGMTANTSAGEQTMLAYCYNVLDTTRTLVLLGEDSTMFNNICIPDNATHRQVLDKVLPALQQSAKHKDFADTAAPIVMVVGLELAYPCKK